MYRSVILGLLSGTLAVAVLAWAWPARHLAPAKPIVLRLDDYTRRESGEPTGVRPATRPAPDLDKPLGEFVTRSGSAAEVVDLLAAKLNASVVFTWPYVQAANAGSGRINLRQCTGRDVLEVLERTHHLQARVYGNIIYLVPSGSSLEDDFASGEPDPAEAIDVRLYDVRDLLTPWSQWETEAERILAVGWVDPMEEICRALAVCCGSGSYVDNVLCYYSGILIVRTSPEIHRRLERSLRILRDYVAGTARPQTRPVFQQDPAGAEPFSRWASQNPLGIYDVRDVLEKDMRFRASANAPPYVDYDGSRSQMLMDMVQNFVDHDSWVNNGGNHGLISFWAGRLVVRQSPATHAKIARFLAQLREGE